MKIFIAILLIVHGLITAAFSAMCFDNRAVQCPTRAG
jgi:hypothetical protein